MCFRRGAMQFARTCLRLLCGEASSGVTTARRLGHKVGRSGGFRDQNRLDNAEGIQRFGAVRDVLHHQLV